MSARLPLSLGKNSLYDVLSEYFFVTVKDDTMEALSWMIVLFVALFCFYKRLASSLFVGRYRMILPEGVLFLQL